MNDVPPGVIDEARTLNLATGWPVKIMASEAGGYLLRAFSRPVSLAAIDPHVFLAETEAAPHLDRRVSAQEIATGGAP